MSSSTYNSLTNAGFIPEQPLLVRKTVVTQEKGIKYTDFCYENEIPMSTYDDIVKGRTNASFYNIFRVISALGLSFEEFGKMLDSKLPENFLKND